MWFFVVVLLLPALAQAQAPAWGQCGGIGWTGPTTCVSGQVCTYSNAYYSQCLPGSESATTTAATTTRTTVSSTATLPSSTSTGTIRHDVGKLPALGWNTWNAYGGNINADKVVQAANDLVSLGLKSAGYQYVNIDDCWPLQSRSSAGLLVPDPAKFPNGISGVASQVHALGLKLGIYGDAGTTTCSGYPGSLTYESVDAQTFSSWGVDYLKYDNCAVPSSWTDAGSYSDWTQSKTYQRYQLMTNAINSVSNPIEFNICDWGQANVWLWGAKLGHSWRMTGDASAAFSFVQSAITNNANYLNYVDFYAHNDMDMMEIGNGGMTIQEERTHFAAWVFMKSPILLGTNLENLNSNELAIVKNAELLAFHQDATVGTAAKPYGASSSPPAYYSGTSSKGTHVFAINWGSSTSTMTVTFASVPGLSSGKSYTVHDMWTGQDIGSFTNSYSASVASHDTLALRIT